jgi:hypothetical protein
LDTAEVKGSRSELKSDEEAEEEVEVKVEDAGQEVEEGEGLILGHQWYAVAVIELHCGHFAYRPILQDRIYRLQALVCAKGQLALELAYNRPPPSTQAGAEALRSAIEAESDVHGLNSLIETLRKELTTLVTGLEALQQLKPRGSPEERRIQADVHQERMAKIREKSKISVFIAYEAFPD